MAFQFAVGDTFKCLRFNKVWQVTRPYVDPSRGSNRYELRKISGSGLAKACDKSETTLSDSSLYELTSGPSFTGSPPPSPPTSWGRRYQKCDKTRSKWSGQTATIVDFKVNHRGEPLYGIVPDGGQWAGRRVWKNADQVDDPSKYELISGPSFMPPAKGAITFSNIDIDETVISAMKKQFAAAIKTQCECGGHKLGYSDQELHGHGRWCPVVTRAFRVPIINEEA